MTRTDRGKRIDPSRADGYAEVGRRLLHAGRAISGHGEEKYASALAILAVHAVIAFADAVSVHLGGRKSTSSDHAAAVKLLRDVLGSRLADATSRDVQRVLAEKDRFEYQGYVARLGEARALLARAERIAAWAEQTLLSLPRSTS